MRIYESSNIVVSKDEVANPTQVRFESSFTEADVLTCNESKTIEDTFPIATTAVDMGNIAAGKLIVIKPTGDCTLLLDAQEIALKGGKESKIWASFATVSIVEATAPNEISILIAGD